MSTPQLRQHFARLAGERKRMPKEQVLAEAVQKIRLYHGWASLPGSTKPRVRVFLTKDGGRPTYVLRVGNRFASGHSWRTLIENAAFGHWKLIHRSPTYSRRWK